jgi:3-phenylpropionate/cinnamic acid dioxygenase small subunit
VWVKTDASKAARWQIRTDEGRAPMTVDADKAEIAEVLVRYASGIDQRDWPLFRTCWTADVHADYEQVGQFTSAEALTDMMQMLHDPMGPTYHRMSNFAITVSGDRANARSYVHAVLMLVPGDSTNSFDAVGHYDDEFIRTDVGWRISRRAVSTARLISHGDLAATAVAQGVPQ